VIDGLFEFVVSALAALAAIPLGFFFPCSPCCGGCGVADGKPRTDPANEGTWVPSGTWRGAGGVTWTFTANPGDDSGETWFFYGSASTSKVGGGASTTEQRDWGNICNWYSNKNTSPSSTVGLPVAFNKRATRLPPESAVVHVYTNVSTVNAGPQVVKYIYFWFSAQHTGPSSSITATESAHGSDGGAVFNNNSQNTFSAVVNGGAMFNDNAANIFSGVVNGGAMFNDGADNISYAVVNGGAVFNDGAANSSSAVVNGGAVFNNNSQNTFSAVVNGGAVFNDNSQNVSFAVVNDGAVFNDNSINSPTATVNGGATFNDAACSQREAGSFFATPCTRKFVAHPTDLPTCNGTAPDGCANSADTCGCG
jgi:hypothetical protein